MASIQEIAASVFTPAWIAGQRKDLPILASSSTCTGGIYIVTGANVGLGFETAKHLVTFGAAKVIIAVRNTSAGEAAKAKIESETLKTGVLDVWAIDLSSFASVQAFAKRASDELERVDAVVENAAVALDEWSVSEGHERTITVNVLGTLLLGILLFPVLVESGKQFGIAPRLVFTASEASWTVKKEWEEIQDAPLKKLDEQTGDAQQMLRRYALSKLIQTLTIRHLASVLPVAQTGVIINYVNPGVCKTELSRNYKGDYRSFADYCFSEYGRTAEMGSRTILHGVVAGKDSHGCYLSACEIREQEVPGWVTDEEGQKGQNRVWDDVIGVLDAVVPGCLDKLL
ncbi:hypothetical protein LTR84_001687 [Exophiala bonariae]|uniref:Uncharacterized protein n=1 Tax=Exophiala bonariae TaxID=1690606 RepID=A0AAV9NEU1_9EURO|nr:hypothetical protein LTR84_001687 [Exophiala bonariae]